jgi:hypothetical protein
MAIRTVVTLGFGNGTFNGTIATVTRLGYAAGAVTPQVGGADNWQEQQTTGWTHGADQAPQIVNSTSYGQAIQSNVGQ